MPDETKSLGQTYYEEVEALKAGGMKNAAAVRAVAEKHQKKENAVRGGIHQYKNRNGDASSTNDGPRRARRTTSKPTVEDHLENAKQSLQAALQQIDQDVSDAKAVLDAAQADYDSVTAAVKDKRAEIEKKLNVMS